jgi:uncharacterized membrane protein
MHHFLEILLGLERGFLSQQGDITWQFNPDWPFQAALQSIGGAAFYNLVLILAGLALIIYVYRREGRSGRVRTGLAVLRGLILLLVILLLNRPVLVLENDRKEPSVVAVLIDDTLSMSVPDVPDGPNRPPLTRLAAAQDLITGQDGQLLNQLAGVHNLRFYRIGPDAVPLTAVAEADDIPVATRRIEGVKAVEDGTQVVRSLQTVLEELQGQRLAAVVILSDGRDIPARERPEFISEVRSKFTVPIFSVPLGQDTPPKTVEVMKPDYEASAFVDDYTVVRFSLRGTGFETGHRVKVTLKTKKDNRVVLDEHGQPVSEEVVLDGETPVPVELSFMPAMALGLNPRRLPEQLPPEDKSLDLIVEAEKQPGQINPDDNVRDVSIQVLDTQIHVLFVDGYPRWEYRYTKNSLIRDKTMKVSCLLTSADPTFVQESTDGVPPIQAFPATLDQLLQYDVVLFGDVDQHEFTDAQLQLISDFVSKRGGGFGMIAGPMYSPQNYRNTALQAILPVDISRTETDDSDAVLAVGFRPILTAEGLASSIFRFYPNKEENRQYVENLSPPLFWYCHGIVPKPTATVLAEHPTELSPVNGRKAPLMVVGQFGAGRSLFSAIDESWRWRFYTGEQIYNAYWVQQIRYLARNRKLDERNVTFEPTQPEYQLGKQVGLDMTVLNPHLSQGLSPQIPVQILDASGQIVKTVVLNRVENTDKYTATWTADSLGRFTARLPAMGSGGAGAGAGLGGAGEDVTTMDRPFFVKSPQLELESPKVDRSMLSSLGQIVDYTKARTELPELIHSAARIIPVEISRPLWEAPLALILFAVLITSEWVLRKLYGML